MSKKEEAILLAAFRELRKSDRTTVIAIVLAIKARTKPENPVPPKS
jgi:hypothetical protein